MFLLGLFFFYIFFIIYFLIEIKSTGVIIDSKTWIILAAIFFVLLAVNIIYFATGKSRLMAKQKREQKYKKKIHDQIFSEANKRFSESQLANSFIDYLRSQNWKDIESYHNCYISTQKITIGSDEFVFRDHCFENLSIDDCRLLAYYFGKSYGKPFSVEPNVHYHSSQAGYHGNIDTNGNITVSPNYNTSERILGYYVYAQIKKEPPVLKKW